MDNVFNLSKEDTTTPIVFDLTKACEDAGIAVPSKIRFGAGWDMPEGEAVMDIDLSVAIIGDNGKLISPESFVFFGQKDKTPGVFMGDDDRTGESSDGGDDEHSIITLADIAGTGIVGSLSVYDDNAQRTLKDAGSCYIRVVNEDTNEEMCRVETSLIDSDAANLIKVSIADGNITVEATEEMVTGDVNKVVASLM